LREKGHKFEGSLHSHGRIALAGGEDGRGDVSEGEVLGRAAGALLPVEKELAVAVGEAGGGVDVECSNRAIDPVGGAFEFGVGADGGLVDDDVRCGVGGRIEDGELGPVLLIEEDGLVAELSEDLGEGVRVGDGGLGLDANLVARGVGVGGLVDAFVSQGVDAAVLAETKDLAFDPEVAAGCVVESVVFVGARGGEMEAEVGKPGLKSLWIGDGELQFDLGSLHGWSIRLGRDSQR
jgi:hypothetical protein